MLFSQNYFEEFGFLLILSVFFLGGFSNLINWKNTQNFIVSKGFTIDSSLVALIASLWQLGGVALSLIPSSRVTGFLTLIVFTLFSSFIFYPFWKMTDVERHVNFILFLSNLGVVGGLVLLIAKVIEPSRFYL